MEKGVMYIVPEYSGASGEAVSGLLRHKKRAAQPKLKRPKFSNSPREEVGEHRRQGMPAD